MDHFHSFLLLCYNSNGALLVEQDHYIEKDKLHDDKITHMHTTYRIRTLRAKCIIEMVFSLLCPTLYAIKVVLVQVRIQNKYLLHIALSRKYKFLLPRTQNKKKKRNFWKNLDTLSLVTRTISRPPSLPVNGLHFRATCGAEIIKTTMHL